MAPADERLRDAHLLQHGLAAADDTARPDLQNPVIYMSRATARDFWRVSGWGEPDFCEDLLFGSMPMLIDDRMELGVAALEEDPDPESTSAGSAGSPGAEG